MEIITITIFSQSSYSSHFILWKDKRLISPVSCPVVSYCLQPGEALVHYLSRFLRTSLLAQETVVVPLPVREVCFFRAGTGNRKVHKDSKWCSLDQSGAWCHQQKSDSCVGLFHLAFFILSDGPRLTACFCICMWFRAHVRQMFFNRDSQKHKLSVWHTLSPLSRSPRSTPSTSHCLECRHKQLA